MKKIIIFGSTGSIGSSLLNIIKKDKKKFHIKLLTANKNYKKLIKQAKFFNVKNLINRAKGASHHMGGLRYDPNRDLSVVDKNLKIIGLKKVYVCSSAIFPTSGSVNPTMTVCALGNKLGDHLIKYL